MNRIRNLMLAPADGIGRRLSVGVTDVELLRPGELPPAFDSYGTEALFYRQFPANADAVEEAGVAVTQLQMDGKFHGLGDRGGWMDAYAQ